MATPADFARIGNYAIMHNPQKNIDRSFQHRTVPMEVLSLGYSRTGTLSMRLALEILGYPNPYVSPTESDALPYPTPLLSRFQRHRDSNLLPPRPMEA
jgi:hypothetical protein